MTLKEQIVQLSGDTHLCKVPNTLREEVILLSEEHLSEEIGEKREDDNCGAKKPIGLVIKDGSVYYNKEYVGNVPSQGEAIFNYREDECPQIVIDYFKDCGYIVKEH